MRVPPALGDETPPNAPRRPRWSDDRRQPSSGRFSLVIGSFGGWAGFSFVEMILSHQTPGQPEKSELEYRLRQQALLAELGRRALGDITIEGVLEEAVRLTALGLDTRFCKVLEYLPDRKIACSSARASDGTRAWSGSRRSAPISRRRRATLCTLASL